MSRAHGLQTNTDGFSSIEPGYQDDEDATAKLHAEIAELQSAYESRNNRTMTLEGELFKQRNQHHALSQNLDRTKSKLETVNVALEKERIFSLAKSEEIEALQVKLGVRAAEFSSLCEREVGLHGELCALRIEHQSLSSARDQIACEVEEIRSALETERLLIAASVEEKETLKEQLAARSDEASHLRECIGKLEEDLSKLRLDHEILSEERDQISCEADGIKAALDAERLLTVTNAKLVEALNLELAARNQEVGSLNGELDLRFKELAVLTRLCEDVDGKLRESENVVHTHTRSLATAHSELTEAHNAANVARRKSKKTAARVESLAMELAEAREASKAAILHATKLEARIAELLGSASWKMTRPFRQLMRARRHLVIKTHRESRR